MNKNQLRRLSFFFFGLALTALLVQAAYVRNYPLKLTQPDGEVVICLVTGDEFHRWVHDRNGYAIIKDPESGYFVYAVRKEGKVVPSSFRVGHWDPLALGLEKNLGPTLALQTTLHEVPLYGSLRKQEGLAGASNIGTINNIVIFVRFSDDSEFGDAASLYDDLFNLSGTGSNSMREYFHEVSYNQLSISSTFYPPSAAGTVVSYQDSQPRGYYRPYDSISNPIGYTSSEDAGSREQNLLKGVITAVGSQVPPDLNVDNDEDGYVDDVCFIVQGAPDAWAQLLWPHAYFFPYPPTVYINDKIVRAYNVQIQELISSAPTYLLCHEMFHVLGAPDLYRYLNDWGLGPAGPWDLMDFGINPPAHMGSYMKFKYGHWIPSIPEITTEGTYSLSPLTSDTNNCRLIRSPASTTEYFVVEYRKKSGAFEGNLPGEGLLVYRINPEATGNGSGPPDEVYIYRPNGTLHWQGDVNDAPFSQDAGRTAINNSTNPSCFLMDGSRGQLSISDIGTLGDTISFTVGWDYSPLLTTAEVTNITETTADSGGNVTQDNGRPVTERGVCWSVLPYPTISDAHTVDGSGTGSFISHLTGLTKGAVLYHVRAYATSSAGNDYGQEVTFRTGGTPPIVTTEVTNITETTANSGGIIALDYGWPVTERGVCWSVLPNPTIADPHTSDGSGTGSFISHLTGLRTCGVLYHVRAYAISSNGADYGEEVTFRTLYMPTVTTATATNITETTADSGGTATDNCGGLPATARGVCWSTSVSPTIADSHTNDGSGDGTFVSHLTGLSPSTLYHVRAYATNSGGTAYGSDLTFRTLGQFAVTSPSNGAQWTRGTRQAIQWTKGPSTNLHVKIVLFKGSARDQDISLTTANSQNFNWHIPGDKAPATNYRIKVKTLDNRFSDFSDYFTILKPTLTIISPTPGTRWNRSSTQTITWTIIGTQNAYVKIQLFRGTSQVRDITLSAPNSGAYDWPIPASLPASANYRIKIKTIDGRVSATSGLFTIQ